MINFVSINSYVLVIAVYMKYHLYKNANEYNLQMQNANFKAQFTSCYLHRRFHASLAGTIRCRIICKVLYQS